MSCITCAFSHPELIGLCLAGSFEGYPACGQWEMREEDIGEGDSSLLPEYEVAHPMRLDLFKIEDEDGEPISLEAALWLLEADMICKSIYLVSCSEQTHEWILEGGLLPFGWHATRHKGSW